MDECSGANQFLGDILVHFALGHTRIELDDANVEQLRLRDRLSRRDELDRVRQADLTLRASTQQPGCNNEHPQ